MVIPDRLCITARGRMCKRFLLAHLLVLENMTTEMADYVDAARPHACKYSRFELLFSATTLKELARLEAMRREFFRMGSLPTIYNLPRHVVEADAAARD